MSDSTLTVQAAVAHGPPETAPLEAVARRLRRRMVELSHTARVSHLGSALSCTDILVAAYWNAMRIDPRRPEDPERDRFILSKGHAALALYTVLAERGFFPLHLLERCNQPGGPLAEHPGPSCAPGVEAATGSLGHGLPIGLGLALAGRIQGRSHRVYVVMGDGEVNEGSVWEAAMLAPAQGLDRVCAVIDYNRWQATGHSRQVMSLDPLADKWRAFGWSAREVDGHDPQAVADVLRRVPDGSGRPVAVIAHTVKGKGVSFMEDDNNWHYRIPSAEDVKRAREELAE